MEFGMNPRKEVDLLGCRPDFCGWITRPRFSNDSVVAMAFSLHSSSLSSINRFILVAQNAMSILSLG
jgi:hypothetical protein